MTDTRTAEEFLADLHLKIVRHQEEQQALRTAPDWVIYRYHRDHGVLIQRSPRRTLKAEELT